MVVIRWNRLGQQHGAVWEAGSAMLAFEIDIDVLGGSVVHGWLIVENEHKDEANQHNKLLSPPVQ